MKTTHEFKFNVGDRVRLGATGEWLLIASTDFDKRMGGPIYMVSRYHADGTVSKGRVAKMAERLEADTVQRQTAANRRRAEALAETQDDLRRAIQKLDNEIANCGSDPWPSEAMADLLRERGWWAHDTRPIWLNGEEDHPDTYEASSMAEAWEYEFEHA